MITLHNKGSGLFPRHFNSVLPLMALGGFMALCALGCKEHPAPVPVTDKCSLPQPPLPDGNPDPYAALGKSNWTFMGPHDWGSRVICIATDPKNPYKLWAGSASGGLWVNENTQGNEGWKWVNTNPYPVLGVGAIAIDPNDPASMYIGTGEVYNYNNTNEGMDLHRQRGVYGIGILHSKDGGTTWAKAEGLPDLQTLGVQDLEIVKGPSGTEVWAATSEGVYLSVAGKPFVLKLDLKMATDVSVDPTNPSHVVAAIGNLGTDMGLAGLYASTNGGSSWNRTYTRDASAFPGKFEFSRSVKNPSLIYALGGTWNREYFYNNQYGTGPNSSPGQCIWPDSAGNNSKTGITWIMRSTNQGIDWDTTQTVLNGFTGGQGHYSIAICANPEDDKHLWMGGVAPLYFSTDGTVTIKPANGITGANGFANGCLSAAMGSFDVHQILMPQGKPGLVYLCSDQGVYMSTDGLKSMKTVNQNLAIMQFYPTLGYHPTNPGILFGCAQDYGPGCLSLMEPDPATGRSRWQLLYGFGHEAGCAAYDTTHDVAYVGIHMGAMMSRTRILHPEHAIDPPDTGYANGAFWFMSDNSPFGSSSLCEYHASWNAPTVLSQVPPQRLYTGKDMVYVSFTHDSTKAAGKIWNPTNARGTGLSGNPILRMVVHPLHPDTLFIATAARKDESPSPMDVYMTTDGGVSWHRITAPNFPTGRNPSCIAIDTAAGGTLYLTFEGFGPGHVWKGKLNGTTCTWTAADQGLPDAFTRAVAVDPWQPGRVFVANDQGVYVSTDGGTSWSSMSQGLPAGLLGVQLIVYKHPRILRVVSHGNGVWQCKI